MRRRTRTWLWLVGVGSVLGVAVFLQIDHETAQLPKPLTDIDPGIATTLEVRCRSCAPRRFEKVDGHWLMRAPYTLPADENAIRRLLAITRTPLREWRPLGDLDLAKLGLDPAEIVLTVDSLRISFGTTDVIDNDRYVRIGPSDRIARVPDRFSPFLLATAESELDHHLVPPASQISKLTINGIERPDLIAEWTTATANTIRKPDAPASPELTSVNADLVLDNGGSIRYRIVHDSDVYLALRKTPDLAYQLSEVQAQTLLAPSNNATP